MTALCFLVLIALFVLNTRSENWVAHHARQGYVCWVDYEARTTCKHYLNIGKNCPAYDLDRPTCRSYIVYEEPDCLIYHCEVSNCFHLHRNFSAERIRTYVRNWPSSHF